MLSNYLKCITWILLINFAFSIGTSFAGISKAQQVWSGIWYDSGGGIISVSEKDGFLDILGKDNASIYSCTGITEGNSAQCFGNGINHAENLRFLYKSKLTLKEQRIEEEWEAVFVGGKKIEGKTVFSREIPSKSR